MVQPYPISQHALATALGISPEDLKKLRDELLVPGEDWLPGKPVTFAESGAKKIRAALELPASGADTGTGSPEPSVEKKPVAERVPLTVLRPAKGTKLIVWCKAGDDRTVRLLVKDNVNFTAGMIALRCVAHPTQPDLYHFEGRLPRWKGRF